MFPVKELTIEFNETHSEINQDSEIETLKNNNVKEIYSYLNIGSIEDFRSYYDEYSAFTLGEYENWDEEKWIDVSNKEWQEFISKRVDVLSQKGIDGFFIDNTDVFYVYPSDVIISGSEPTRYAFEPHPFAA